METYQVYKIIHSEYASALVEKVNKFLLEGWKINGQPFTRGNYIYQALIMEV